MVQFFQGAASIGAAPVVSLGSSLVATLPANSYQGDGNFSGSSTQTAAVAAKAQVSIASGHNPAIAGQPVTFTVQVSTIPGTAMPEGGIQLSSDGAIVGTLRWPVVWLHSPPHSPQGRTA